MALIKPEIYAPLVREKFEGKIRVAKMATNLGYLAGTTQGDTIRFPKYKLIGDATELTKGQAIPSEELDQDYQEVKIKHVAAKGVQIYDIDNVTMMGNAINEGATQQGTTIARKIDSDLINAALTSPLKSATALSNKITAQELLTALELYGDERDIVDFEGIIISELLYSSFIGMDEFVSTGKTYTTDNNGIVREGLIGYFLGIPVVMTSKGTYDSVKQECITLIIKKRALGYMPKKEVNVEPKREAEYKRTTVYTDTMYAVALLADDGVVVVRKTIA